jgi:hypothetical protein
MLDVIVRHGLTQIYTIFILFSPPDLFNGFFLYFLVIVSYFSSEV